MQKFHFFVTQDSRKETTKLKHEFYSNLQVYELPIDANQKRCSKCPPFARTLAVKQRCHWHIAPIWQFGIFVYQQQQHNVTTT